MKKGYVYLMASKRNGTLYLGVTSDLSRRIWEHQTYHNPSCFTAVNHVHTLVWFEDYDLIADAIQREKTMKGWPREWKVTLIEAANPKWHPLHPKRVNFRECKNKSLDFIQITRSEGRVFWLGVARYSSVSSLFSQALSHACGNRVCPIQELVL